MLGKREIPEGIIPIESADDLPRMESDVRFGIDEDFDKLENAVWNRAQPNSSSPHDRMTVSHW